MNHLNMYEPSVNFGSNDFSWLDDMEKEEAARYDTKNIIHCILCSNAGRPERFNNNEELVQHEKQCPSRKPDDKKPVIAKPDFICPVPGCGNKYDGDNSKNFKTHYNSCKNKYDKLVRKNIDTINELLKTIPIDMLDKIIMPSKD
jgi:hypothetical protein